MTDLDLLVVGDCNPDLVLAGDVTPRFASVEQLVDRADLVIGGSGSILACGAACLGLRVAMASVVGDDVFGRFMLDALAERGVETTPIARSDSEPTGLSVILARTDDRAILTRLGTIDAVAAEHVPRSLLARTRHVHVASYYLLHRLMPHVPALFAAAHELGVTTSLDTNWDPSERWQLDDVLEHTDILLPNATEAMYIARATSLTSAAGHLRKRVGTLAVKLGSEGAVAYRGDDHAHVSAPPLVAVDAIGAGDSFGAGFLAGTLMGEPLEGALRLAVACGSLSTRAAGGTAAQPTLDEARAVALGSVHRHDESPATDAHAR